MPKIDRHPVFEAAPRHICTRRSATATDAVYEYAAAMRDGPPPQWDWVDRERGIFQLKDGWLNYQVTRCATGWAIYAERRG